MTPIYRLFCFVILVASGNPALGYFNSIIAISVPAVAMMMFAFFNGMRITRTDLVVLGIFGFVLAVHTVLFGGHALSPSAACMLRVLMALCAARTIPNFPRHLLAVMEVMALLSLLLMLPVWLGINMAQIVRPLSIPFSQNGIQPSISIGIHNYRLEVIGMNRNCGMFWEPGAYAGYLVFSMLYLIGDRSRQAMRRFFILSVTLISTQSTTGYIAFVVVMTGYVWHLHKSFVPWVQLAMRVFFVALIPAAAALGYTHVPFLKEKIVEQAQDAQSEESGWQLTRFGNAIYDYRDIIKRPLFGWSMDNKTRNEPDDDILSRQGNGLTGATVRLGIPLMAIYFGLVFVGFRRLYRSALLGAIATLTIILLLVGEQFFLYPLFMTLMFLPPAKPKPFKRQVRRYENRGHPRLPQPA